MTDIGKAQYERLEDCEAEIERLRLYTADADMLASKMLAEKDKEIERLREEAGKAQYNHLEDCEAKIERLRAYLQVESREAQVIRNENVRLRAERDELLAALKQIAHGKVWLHAIDAQSIARHAIAKAESDHG